MNLKVYVLLLLMSAGSCLALESNPFGTLEERKKYDQEQYQLLKKSFARLQQCMQEHSGDTPKEKDRHCFQFYHDLSSIAYAFKSARYESAKKDIEHGRNEKEAREEIKDRGQVFQPFFLEVKKQLRDLGFLKDNK